MPDKRPPSSIAALLVVVLLLLAAGCGRSDPPDRRDPTTPAPATSVTGRWITLSGPCPTLNGETAKSLNKSGPGKPGPANIDTPVLLTVGCTWGEGEGSVGASVYLNRTDGPQPADQTTEQEFQEAFDKDVADGSIVRWRPEAGLEDKAYLGINKDQATIELWVLSSNARIVVYHQIPRVDEGSLDEALAQHRDTMRGLAADVLDDLA